jgi:hypothetical protein
MDLNDINNNTSDKISWSSHILYLINGLPRYQNQWASDDNGERNLYAFVMETYRPILWIGRQYYVDRRLDYWIRHQTDSFTSSCYYLRIISWCTYRIMMCVVSWCINEHYPSQRYQPAIINQQSTLAITYGKDSTNGMIYSYKWAHIMCWKNKLW